MEISPVPTQTDIDTAKLGIKIQFEAMFDQTTREKMMELGIQQFLDHCADMHACDAAYVRFYANFTHLGIKK